jgi:hypothetical protein
VVRQTGPEMAITDAVAGDARSICRSSVEEADCCWQSRLGATRRILSTQG